MGLVLLHPHFIKKSLSIVRHGLILTTRAALFVDRARCFVRNGIPGLIEQSLSSIVSHLLFLLHLDLQPRDSTPLYS